MSRAYVILLNWNNWPDTLECLESLLALDYPDYRILVCDNASTDGSLKRLQDWASGALDIVAENRSLHLDRKPYPKPLKIKMVNALALGNEVCPTDETLVTILCNQANLGFAGGYNVGLRYALGTGNVDYCWVLNNDTVVDPHALTALVERLQTKPDAGLCGSSVFKYRKPDIVDALGGAYYSRWLGLAWHLGRERRFPAVVDPEKIEKRMDYVVGSSMLVSRRFLHDVGLMDESYFLYYEELDWAMQGRGRFSLAYAPDSLVYHKIGGSIGTSTHPARKTLVSDFYTLRNRIKFTRRYFAYALPVIYLGLVCAAGLRLLFGQWQKARMVRRLMLNPHLSFDQCTTSL